MVPPSDASPEGGDLSPKELLPQVDYDAIIRIVQKAQPRKGKGEDEVEARLFLLADDRAVLLDAAEETTSLVLDLAQEQASRRIRRVSVGQVESGMFLLLRTQGAGDYIVEIADAMLGARRKELRELQTRWKQLLRDLVVSSGRDQVCQRLFRSGSTIANAMNLQNWISYRTIRPREKTDLSAIMACIGWSARADEVWEKMGHIDRAHRMAGHRIRKMLLKEVSHTNLHEMRSRSRLDFTIPNVESGSLSACLVEDTYKGTVTASERQLGQIFEREVGPMLELDFGTDTHLA